MDSSLARMESIKSGEGGAEQSAEKHYFNLKFDCNSNISNWNYPPRWLKHKISLGAKSGPQILAEYLERFFYSKWSSLWEDTQWDPHKHQDLLNW